MKALIDPNGSINAVENIAFKVHKAFKWIPCDNNVTTDYTYKGGSFIAPKTKTSLEVWREKIDATDKDMPRLIEDIIDALDAPTRARVDIKTLDKYNAKKALRASKPV